MSNGFSSRSDLSFKIPVSISFQCQMYIVARRSRSYEVPNPENGVSGWRLKCELFRKTVKNVEQWAGTLSCKRPASTLTALRPHTVDLVVHFLWIIGTIQMCPHFWGGVVFFGSGSIECFFSWSYWKHHVSSHLGRLSRYNVEFKAIFGH